MLREVCALSSDPVLVMAGELPPDISTLLQNGEQLARLSVALAALSTEALKANVRHLQVLQEQLCPSCLAGSQSGSPKTHTELPPDQAGQAFDRSGLVCGQRHRSLCSSSPVSQGPAARLQTSQSQERLGWATAFHPEQHSGEQILTMFLLGSQPGLTTHSARRCPELAATCREELP